MAQPRKTAAKPAAKRTAPKVTKKLVIAPAAPELTPEQRQAKLNVYHSYKQGGLKIPAELATEVEGWIAEARTKQEAEDKAIQAQAEQRAEQLDAANANGPWYIRNGTFNPFNLRLDRQTEKRRLELKPRGTPGDLHPIKEEDLQDPVLRRNVNLGLVELIPAGEASLIIEKQTTNIGTRVHAPLSILRNELGQPYEQGAVKVEAEFNSQGVTVATLDPAQMQGHIEDKRVQVMRQQPGQPVPQQQGPQPATSVVSGFVPTGGNPAIISQGGFQADAARAKAADDLARRRGVQGPAAGLPGDVTVTVAPVQRT